MTSIVLKVPGIPRPQPRHRARGVLVQDGLEIKARAKMYDPTTKSLASWKAKLRIAAYQQRPTKPWMQGVRVDIEAFFDRPAWFTAKVPSGAIPMLDKPDRDNLDKVILDTLTKLQYWGDDCQVYCGQIKKFYRAVDCVAGAIITITFIELDASYEMCRQRHREVLASEREKNFDKRCGRTSTPQQNDVLPQFKFSEDERPFTGNPVKANKPQKTRPRPLYNGPALINETISIDQLASEMAAGRKVRV